MTYRAEIEIGVKGARQLRDVTEQVQTLAERVDLISANFKPFIQTIQQFESNLSRASATLKRVRAGTDDEVAAIKQYVQAVGQANTARARQNNLIQQEIALQEAAKRKTQPGPTGFSRAEFGPALPPAFIKQQNDQQNFKNLFADLNETAKVISVSNTNTRTSWKRTFDELNETAKAISVSRLNTQTSWQETFKQLNETAKAISVSRLNTQTSWQETFKQLNETAKAIAVNRLNTQTSWQETFKQLNETAKAISVSRLNTQTSWQETFKQLNETAKAISVSRLNTKKAWQDFFKDATEVAQDLRRDAARVSLRNQERPLFVQETISRGRSARIARERSAFLQGSSGPVQLGPSGRGPGASGFPVAVPLNRAEQKAVNLQNRKLQILNRIKRTRQDLVGLAANLQRLDNNAVVAIADANRQQKQLNKNKQKSLEISKAIAKSNPVGGAENIPGSPAFLKARSQRRREGASNALIGGAFPLLFGQGAGASLGGALGGGLGGLAGGQFGFGLSLVGTAVGQAIDTLNKKLSDLASNIKEPTQALGSLEELGFRVSDSVKKQVQELEKAGLVYDAQTIVFEEIANRLGTNAVNQLNALNDASNDLQDEIGELQAEILTVLLPALGAATSAIATIASVLNNLKVPETLLNAAIGTAAGALSPGLTPLIPKDILGQGVRQGLNNLFPGTEPDRSTEQAAQQKLEAIEKNKLSVVNQRIALVGQEKNLLDQTVFAAEEKLIKDQFTGKVLQANLNLQGKALAIKNAELERDTALSSLQNRRAAQQERINREALRGAKRGATADKALEREALREQKQFESAEISLLRAKLEFENVLERGVSIDLGREAGVQGALENLSKKNELEKQIQDKIFEQRKSQAGSLRVLAQINEEQRIANEILTQRNAAEKISLENDLERLQLARERASFDLKTSFVRNVEDAQFGLRQAEVAVSDPFGGQQQQTSLFNLEQERERLELTRRLTDQRLALKQAVEDADEASKIGAQENLRIFDAQKTQLEDLLARRQAVEQQQLKQNQILEKYGFIINEVSTALSSSIQAIITGTGSVQEAFTTLFENIGRAFVDLATQVLAQKAFLAVLNLFNPGGGLFGGGGGGSFLQGVNNPLNISDSSGFDLGGFFANGGNPPVNRPSIVGERGPELFVPRTSGTVVSNDALEALSRYRPENSAQRSNQTVNVNYNVTEVNGMRYVTEEQFRAGLDQAAKTGAKMGQSMTISTLKNSRSQRSKIGL